MVQRSTMQRAAANNIINKSSILGLYRRCIRSAQKMPDPNQCASYLIHIRDGFNRRAHLASNSREALLAYRDGMEQVEQMEYYHSQMKMKQNEENETATDTPKIEIVNSPLSHDANTNPPIEQWLLRHLPHLKEADVTKYSQHLVDDGFDSVAFIEEELLEEDLSFMKKAHRRVIARQLR
mmetsp:Transcript_24636/g.53398  ORF Transcript_24636/g.53398 Transcript_24636/m.53398 type:complete len:180 (-) Transcript_24636:1598-2137(-)